MRVLLATAFAMTTALDTRWDAATALLASTVPARRTRDHRAKHAVVIGAVDDLITAVQPDRGGRKLVFLASDGALVGELGLSAHEPETSLLRGARVDVTARGRGDGEPADHEVDKERSSTSRRPRLAAPKPAGLQRPNRQQWDHGGHGRERCRRSF